MALHVTGPAGDLKVKGPGILAPPAPPRKRWWHHWKLILAGAVATPLLAFACYTWSTLQ